MLVCREITKRFETLSFASVGELLRMDLVAARGELTCVIGPAPEAAPPARTGLAGAEIARLLADELPPAQAARLAARITGEPRAELYAAAAHGEE